jgi:secreted PhoX family phosphatase
MARNLGFSLLVAATATCGRHDDIRSGGPGEPEAPAPTSPGTGNPGTGNTDPDRPGPELPALALPTGPRSAMVALTLHPGPTDGPDLPTHVRELVGAYARGRLPQGVEFPLPAASTDDVRTITGIEHQVVVGWLDRIGSSEARYGANNDYIAYFGDGWNDGTGRSPQWNGSGSSAWVWVNHEYVSNDMPEATAAPTGQHLMLARFLRETGVLDLDPDSPVWPEDALTQYIHSYKTQVGGSWLHLIRDPVTGRWQVDPGAEGLRYDASSATLLRVTGRGLASDDHDDQGNALPAGVVAGIAGDCSGAQTPWGTLITAEENVQDYYGDVEACWTSQQRFVAGQGFDPGQWVQPNLAPSASGQFGRIADPAGRHSPEFYGYLVEIDPGVAPGEFDGSVQPGRGHRKLGAIGRARWENATFAVNADFQLVPNRPVVLYSADDRRGGRIYKFVSRGRYRPGMDRAQIRDLLNEGRLYAAHFAGLDNTTGNTLVATGQAPTEARPGVGQWIELSVTSTDRAPNAAALGAFKTTVGAALSDIRWNGLGGFATDDDVRGALFTASAKVGIMELNRPEDIEWNPRDLSGRPRLYVAFTNHGRKTQLDQQGVLFPPEVHDERSPLRDDKLGAIFAIEEANLGHLDRSRTFRYFQVWRGSEGTGPFDAANPDNLMLDAHGGLWFGTDGNHGVNGHADALYYLDLDPAHRAGKVGSGGATHGLAFRVAAAPSDAEATGPAFSSDMRTIFFSVQHPGEDTVSVWP